VRAATNLADLYREQGRDDQGEAVLRAALAVAWEQAPLQHALGLLLVRRGDRQGGLELLAAATRNQPGNARFAFVHGVALVEDGQVDAGLATVQRAHELQPDDAELLLGLATLTRAHRSAAAALPWAQQLADLRPADPAAQQLLAELRAAARQGR
jgi:Flp pilus assembly protein TadD